MKVKIKNIGTAVMGGVIYSGDTIDTFADKEVDLIRNEGCFSLVELGSKQAWIDRADIEKPEVKDNK